LLAVALLAALLMAACGSSQNGADHTSSSGVLRVTDQGVILEKGPPSEVIGNPKEERTRQFLERVLNPL
jgi:ABC-type histidine transport system ATPase subunit